MPITQMLLHIWLIPAIFLLGSAWSLNSTWTDCARIVGLSFGWPITWPGIWLINKLTR